MRSGPLEFREPAPHRVHGRGTSRYTDVVVLAAALPEVDLWRVRDYQVATFVREPWSPSLALPRLTLLPRLFALIRNGPTPRQLRRVIRPSLLRTGIEVAPPFWVMAAPLLARPSIFPSTGPVPIPPLI